jgi:two-component system sporulation sensor kinase A
MNIKQLIAPEDLPSIMNRLAARIRGEKEIPPIQFDLIRSDGTRRPIEIHTKLLTDEGGRPIGVQGIARDITERKRMEEKLRNSEARFREMANLLPQIVFETDLSGNYTFANHSGLVVGGYTEEDMLNGLNAFQTFAEQDRGRALENLGRILMGQDIGPTEYTALRKDGSTFPVLVHSTAIVHEGKVVGVRGVAMDITEQKRMEDALRESEKRFREMTDMLPEAVFELDLNGKLTYMNRTGVKMMGLDDEDLKKGLSAFQAISAENLSALKENISRILRGGPSPGYEYEMVRKDGSRFPAMAYASPIIKERKAVGLRGVVVDITERKKTEEELLKSRHLAAVGEAAAMVGHDLRNPLQTTTTTLYLTKKLLSSGKPEDKSEGLALLNVLDDQVYYMDKIVSDLQDYAKPASTELTETNLPELIREVISNVKIPGSVKVSTLVKGDPPNAVASPVLLRRVLVNLVLNAVQAMPNGGQLTITTNKTQDSAAIAVQDTGTGIPAENLEKIFNPFFTTKAQGQGLGLAVCKRLIEAQDGEITVKSEVDKGSTFTIMLPPKRSAKALTQSPS